MTSRDRTGRAARLGRWLRLHGLRALRENSTPTRTALGVALGAFIGIFPSFGVGGPVAFFLAGRWGLNRAAAIGGVVLSMNPLTAPVLVPLSAWLGIELLNPERIESEATGIVRLVADYGGAFLLGNTLVAVAVAILFGAVVFWLVKRKGGLRALVIKPRYGPQAQRAARPASDIRPAA